MSTASLWDQLLARGNRAQGALEAYAGRYLQRQSVRSSGGDVRVGERVLVDEVIAVEDLQTGRDATSFTTSELFRRQHPEAPLTWTGTVPVRASRSLEMAGYDVRQLLDDGGRTAASGTALPRGRPRQPSRVSG